MDTARAVVFCTGLLAFLFWAMQWVRARRGRSESGRVVNHGSRTGILIEALAAAVLIFWPQPHPSGLPLWFYAVASALALASAALGIRAGLHLGKQMRVQAVVTAGHRLITSGPYSVVRHPIYTCLLGLFLAAGLVYPHPVALLVAGPVFLIGTEVRMRAEDKLLAEHFGTEFDEYRRRVRSYLPGIR